MVSISGSGAAPLLLVTGWNTIILTQDKWGISTWMLDVGVETMNWPFPDNAYHSTSLLCRVRLLSLLCDVNTALTVHTVSGHPVHLHHPHPANEHQSVSVTPLTSRVAPNMPGQPRHSGDDIVIQCVRAEYCSSQRSLMLIHTHFFLMVQMRNFTGF